MKTLKTGLILFFFLTASKNVLAAPERFSCERIKEKGVREACIKDRTTGERAEKEEKARIAAAEKEKEEEREKELKAIAEKNKALDEFVSKSKQVLVQNLKDPDSAKFTNLVIAQNADQKLLCGSINAKNSYGGYVGAKKFYVLWSDATPETPEVYTEGDEMARANARLDELMKVGKSAGISAQIAAAKEGDKVVANARKEFARSSKILSDQCTAPISTITAVIDK